MRKLASAGALVALLLACGCDLLNADNLDLDLAAWTPVAVGATSTAKVVDACISAGKGDTCSTETVWASSASVDDPSILSLAPVTGSSPVVSFTVLRAGTTTLRVDGASRLNHESLSAPIVARVANQVQLVLPVSCTSPYRFSTDLEVMIPYQLRADGERLWGTGLLPFASTVATVEASRSTVDVLGATAAAFRTSATPGTGAITSPIDGTLSVPLVVHGLGEIEALSLSDIPDGLPAYVRADARVAGEALCADAFPRVVQVDTPATCTLARYGEGTVTPSLAIDGAGPFHVIGMVGGGTCTLTASLTGTAISVTRSYAF